MKRFAAWMAITAASVVLAACEGGGDGASEAAAAAVEVGGPSGKELADVQILRIGNGAEIQTLDPHRGEEVQGSNVQRDLYEGLVNEAPNGDIVPGVAESWTASEDGKTYVFQLRHDARWSNGDPVTTADFVYGFRRAVDPKTLSTYSFILSPIENADAIAAGKQPPVDLGVRALDDYTLEIKLVHPTPYFVGLLQHSMTYPLHRASFEQYGDQFTKPGNLVSNGAFQLADWVVQSHIKLVRNPHYWNNANTKLDEVWFYPTEDQSAELQRYRANELDITDVVPATQVKWIHENLASEFVVAPYLGSYFYGFNTTRPPFKDQPKLRRALALALDREVITEQVDVRGYIPSFGWVPPVAHYKPQQMPEATWTQAEREAEAKRLYAEAGYSAEKPLRTELMYNTQDNHRRVAVAIASMWKRVLGVETEIINQEWKVYLDTRNKKVDTQVYRHGWIGDYNDAFTFAEMLRTTAGLNDTGYSNPEYDRLVTAAQSELDLDKRGELLEAAERVMLVDLPILPIYTYVTARMVKPWVGGYQSNIMDHHPHKDLYILKH
jgi:oligopeptide transport system substrate-binding protein